MDGDDLAETDLLRRTQRGDGDAFRALFDRHLADLEGRVRRMIPAALRRKISVSDVVQETRITAFSRCGTFDPRGPGALRAWLLRIAELKAREALRRHAGTAKRAAGREVSRGGRMETGDLPGGGPTPSEHAMAAESREAVRRALDALPEDYREILRLTRFEGLTLADAAGRMGRSREAVKKLHGRAMVRLARLLDGEGGRA
jgi:RNA polymerase sigma-70 factor (ECF subfamily)